MNEREREKLEVLDGSRTGSKSRAAVRHTDLAPIVSLKPITATKETGATVTVAKYNALLADFTALRQALVEIAAKVKP